MRHSTISNNRKGDKLVPDVENLKHLPVSSDSLLENPITAEEEAHLANMESTSQQVYFFGNTTTPVADAKRHALSFEDDESSLDSQFQSSGPQIDIGQSTSADALTKIDELDCESRPSFHSHQTDDSAASALLVTQLAKKLKASSKGARRPYQEYMK